MSGFDICDHIRKRPGIYVDGDKSLKRVRSFLVGYEVGLAQKEKVPLDDLDGFNSWVANRLGYRSSSMGWCNMITEKAGSDEKAFDLFFDLLEEFKRQKR